jgi:hypothetical protein
LQNYNKKKKNNNNNNANHSARSLALACNDMALWVLLSGRAAGGVGYCRFLFLRHGTARPLFVRTT